MTEERIGCMIGLYQRYVYLIYNQSAYSDDQEQIPSSKTDAAPCQDSTARGLNSGLLRFFEGHKGYKWIQSIQKQIVDGQRTP